MHIAKRHSPVEATRVLSDKTIQKIKGGTNSRIIEIFAHTNDEKLPTDCLAIAKSTITTANKTITTPSYPISYGVCQKKDGTIDVHIDGKSLDPDFLESVTSNIVNYLDCTSVFIYCLIAKIQSLRF